jgi:amino acid transporter
MAERVPAAPQEEPTIGKIVGDISKDVSALIRSEIELAKSEVKVSVKAGGVGLGLFAAAVFLVLLAVIMLSVALAYFIHFTGLDLAWCFLIVFGGYVLIAALLGFIGYRSVQRVRMPEASIEQLKETRAVLKRG